MYTAGLPLQSNGANHAEVKPAQPVTFNAIEVSPHPGKVVAAEWEFEGRRMMKEGVVLTQALNLSERLHTRVFQVWTLFHQFEGCAFFNNSILRSSARSKAAAPNDVHYHDEYNHL